MKTNAIEWMPVPYFKLNSRGDILSYSKQVTNLFTPVDHFLELVHIDDQLIAKQLLNQSSFPPIRVSLKLNIHHGFFGLFACTINWQDNVGHLVCTETNSEVMALERQLKAEQQILKTKQLSVKSNDLLLKSIHQLVQKLESTFDK
ncbi:MULTISPECIES: hypothetical protein [Priestia]|jgi:hypothetical protein|uniref:hypothetical protein n=1 Tax=Priestia TaxID=2800373 RepID=UPI00203EF37F|nr:MULTISPECIES: hypothetical protein [Priestia]MCM3772398.1 hypothetical protein [Priestia aryabhattai]MDY0943908.1 hypothetical protein [Priestia megaterium]